MKYALIILGALNFSQIAMAVCENANTPNEQRHCLGLKTVKEEQAARFAQGKNNYGKEQVAQQASVSGLSNQQQLKYNNDVAAKIEHGKARAAHRH